MAGVSDELQPFGLHAGVLDTVRAELELAEADAVADDELAELRAELLAAVLPEADRRGDDELRHEPAAAGRAELELDEGPLEAGTVWPIGRTCSTAFRALRTSGARRLSAIELGVVHCTQGSTARGAAAWFANPLSQGSAHVVVDGRECYRTLPPSVIPWGARGVNTTGWHLEIAGFAQWTRAQWLGRPKLLERAAYKLAQNGRGRFPVRFLSDRQLAAVIRRDPNRVRGIVSHRQVSRVVGGSHWDPGTGFPWDVYLALARKFEAQLRRR